MSYKEKHGGARGFLGRYSFIYMSTQTTDLHIVIGLKKRSDGSFSISGIDIDNGFPVPAVEKPKREPKSYSKLTWLTTMSDEEAQDVATLCGTTPDFVRIKSADLFNYCSYKGKTYKDYRLFLINAVKKDKPSGSQHLNL